MKNNILLVFASLLFSLSNAQNVKIKYNKMIMRDSWNNNWVYHPYIDTLESKIILFSDKKKLYGIDKNEKLIKYKYLDNTPLIKSILKHNTIFVHDITKRNSTLFENDKYGVISMYETPYEYLFHSPMTMDTIFADTIMELVVWESGRIRTVSPVDSIPSYTMYTRCDKDVGHSFLKYGILAECQFKFFMYTTIKGKLVSDRFVMREYIIDRTFVYDEEERLTCVLTTRTLTLNGFVTRWKELFEYTVID